MEIRVCQGCTPKIKPATGPCNFFRTKDVTIQVTKLSFSCLFSVIFFISIYDLCLLQETLALTAFSLFLSYYYMSVITFYRWRLSVSLTSPAVEIILQLFFWSCVIFLYIFFLQLHYILCNKIPTSISANFILQELFKYTIHLPAISWSKGISLENFSIFPNDLT